MGMIRAITFKVVMETTDPESTKEELRDAIKNVLEAVGGAVVSSVTVTRVSKPYPDNLED